jgi:hypothetical protein
MSATTYSFGEWLPDLPETDNPGLVEARNVIPADGSYAPYLPLSVNDTALGARIIGAFAGLDSSGNPAIYAGTQTSLSLKVGSSWTTVSAATYSAASSGYWKFAQYKNLVIATNGTNTLGAATVGAGNFTALATSGTAPACRHVAIVNQFVVVGDTAEAINGTVPHRVQWSGIDLPRSWQTPGSATAIAQQSGEQFLGAEFGAVMGIFGGDQIGIIGQKLAMTRMTYAGPPVVFQFDTIDRTHGIWFPNSAAQVGRLVYYASFDGFWVTDGVSTTHIGSGKVDRLFINGCDQTYIERVRGAIDYQNNCYVVCYPDSLAVSGTPNRMLYYNWLEKRWSHADDQIELLFAGFTAGFTLDQLDTPYPSLDAMGPSLDSVIFQGGVRQLAGFSTAHKLGNFSGSPGTARFDSTEVQINPEGRFFLSGIQPQVSGTPSAITAAISTRNVIDNSSPAYATAVARTARTGICDTRMDCKYAAVRIEVTGPFSKAMGFRFMGRPSSGV